jgi:hypothetical protein
MSLATDTTITCAPASLTTWTAGAENLDERWRCQKDRGETATTLRRR